MKDGAYKNENENECTAVRCNAASSSFYPAVARCLILVHKCLVAHDISRVQSTHRIHRVVQGGKAERTDLYTGPQLATINRLSSLRHHLIICLRVAANDSVHQAFQALSLWIRAMVNHLGEWRMTWHRGAASSEERVKLFQRRVSSVEMGMAMAEKQ